MCFPIACNFSIHLIVLLDVTVFLTIAFNNAWLFEKKKNDNFLTLHYSKDQVL